MIVSTEVGTVDVLVQSADTVLVRSGSQLPNHGPRDEMERQEDARQPLELGRGITADVHAHFARSEDGTWAPHRGYTSLRRVDNWGIDVPPGATAKAWAAIGDALLREVSDEYRDDAQREKNLGQAADLRECARGLSALVDQINRQASELEADPSGARWVYLTQRLSSGTSQRAQAVRTAAGELVFADEPRSRCPEGDRQLRRYRDESAPWTEDR